MIEEYYNNRDNCYNDLLIARQTLCSGTSTLDQIEQVEKTLGLMYVYCPEDIMVLVISLMEESEIRKNLRKLGK